MLTVGHDIAADVQARVRASGDFNLHPQLAVTRHCEVRAIEIADEKVA